MNTKGFFSDDSTKTIQVKGFSRILVAPDQIEVSITIRESHEQYVVVRENEKKRAEAIRATLALNEIDPQQLKSKSFSIEPDYETQYDGHGNTTSKFIGFVCWHTMSLYLDMDMGFLGKVVEAICSCEAEPELNILFKIKEPGVHSKDLLEQAVLDAKNRARILAKAAGVDLHSVLHIEYTGETSHTPIRMLGETHVGAYNSFMNEPKHIELNEEVLMIWAIGD